MLATTRFFKRHRMERRLGVPAAVPPLPEGFFLVPWHDRLTDIHADVKFRCFADDIDSQLFPNLGSVTGCRMLMRYIRDRTGFCPRATWLAAGSEGYCGTVQGVIDSAGIGAIQNLGVVPDCRGFGLGSVLLAAALDGFARCGVTTVRLDVTAENTPAVRLYRKFGFRYARTTYRTRDGE